MYQNLQETMPQDNLQLKNQRKTLLDTRTLMIMSAVIIVFMAGIFSLTQSSSTQSFTNVAVDGGTHAGSDMAISGSKDGGFAWGDLNHDGYLDLVVNTNSSSKRTRILISNHSDSDNPYFEDLTSSYCSHCTTVTSERSAMIADINHDGYVDMIRTTYYYIYIYLNQGPTNNYQLGVGTSQTPNKTITKNDFHDNKMNTEGVMLMDYDNDGWLDLGIENHNFGIDILINPKDGSANFTCADPLHTGLPTSATDGDYAACVDFDNDGDIDLVGRKNRGNDFFVNTGGGKFNAGQDLADANNSNKGSVVFADFDNDGDFDLYWSDEGDNQIWINDGTDVLVATKVGSADGEPWKSAGVSAPSSGIAGAAVGDVNNDGKMDLFLTASSGPGYLFLNGTTAGGSLSFTQDNMGININGHGEGVAFADYDNDGDLDLYINCGSIGNHLWRNSLNDENYLMVEPRIDLGSGLWRNAVGANISIQDCNGNRVAGIKEVPTTAGHGTDAPDRVHFGLPSGPTEVYMVTVDFVTVNGVRQSVQKEIRPADLADQTLVVYDTDPNELTLCSQAKAANLPVEWLDFTVTEEAGAARLDWATSQELNSSHYAIERSTDGRTFTSISQVASAGNSDEVTTYAFTDTDVQRLQQSKIYYRLQQVDMDGAIDYSKVVELSLEAQGVLSLGLYPNPARDQATLRIEGLNGSEKMIRVLTMDGKLIWTARTSAYEEALPIQNWAAGSYAIQVISGKQVQTEKLIINK